jgi:hypothetical protein
MSEGAGVTIVTLIVLAALAAGGALSSSPVRSARRS